MIVRLLKRLYNRWKYRNYQWDGSYSLTEGHFDDLGNLTITKQQEVGPMIEGDSRHIPTGSYDFDPWYPPFTFPLEGMAAAQISETIKKIQGMQDNEKQDKSDPAKR